MIRRKQRYNLSNPHMHIMVPIRPLQEDGTWGQKQKKVPVLDTGWTASFESERTAGVSGSAYNGLEQERNFGRIEKCLGKDVQ